MIQTQLFHNPFCTMLINRQTEVPMLGLCILLRERSLPTATSAGVAIPPELATLPAPNLALLRYSITLFIGNLVVRKKCSHFDYIPLYQAKSTREFSRLGHCVLSPHWKMAFRKRSLSKRVYHTWDCWGLPNAAFSFQALCRSLIQLIRVSRLHCKHILLQFWQLLRGCSRGFLGKGNQARWHKRINSSQHCTPQVADGPIGWRVLYPRHKIPSMWIRSVYS